MPFLLAPNDDSAVVVTRPVDRFETLSKDILAIGPMDSADSTFSDLNDVIGRTVTRPIACADSIVRRDAVARSGALIPSAPALVHLDNVDSELAQEGDNVLVVGFNDKTSSVLSEAAYLLSIDDDAATLVVSQDQIEDIFAFQGEKSSASLVLTASLAPPPVPTEDTARAPTPTPCPVATSEPPEADDTRTQTPMP